MTRGRPRELTQPDFDPIAGAQCPDPPPDHPVRRCGRSRRIRIACDGHRVLRVDAGHARNVPERTRHPEPVDVEIDLARRLVERRPPGFQQLAERFHFRTRLLEGDATQSRLRQPPASLQQRGRPFRLDARLDLIPDLGTKLIALQVAQDERLVGFQHAIVEIEPHAKPVPEQEACRIGEEGDELGEVDAAQGFVRLRQRGPRESAREFAAVRSRVHRRRRLAHSAGIADEALVARGIARSIAGGRARRSGRPVHRARCEVARAERLEGVQGLELRPRETAAEVVLQLVHEHRRRNWGVVAKAPPGIGHDEASPGCEQCVEEGVSVLVPNVTVAPPGGPGRQDVERRRSRRTRKHAVVHSRETHDLCGMDPAHREGRDGHAVREPDGSAAGRPRSLPEHVEHHLERNRRLRVFRLATECADESADPGGLLGQLAGKRPVSGGFGSVGQQAFGHLQEHPLPPRRRKLAFETLAEPEHLLAVRDEPSEQRTVQLSAVESRTRRHAGHEAGDRRRRIRHRVTEHEPLQSLAPCVSGGSRQAFTDPMRLVHAPSDAGLPDDAANDGKIGFTDSETSPDRRRRQRRQDRLGIVSGPGERQEVEESAHRPRIRLLHAGDAARNASRRREHRLDGGPVDLEIGSQHEHVRGLEIRMCVEQRQQAVVQDLGLAHRRVADVDLERVIPRGRTPRGRPGERAVRRRVIPRRRTPRFVPTWGCGRRFRNRPAVRSGCVRGD